MDPKLEIYKMAAELSDRVSARRMLANGFFLTINTTLLSILGFTYEKLAIDKRSMLMIIASAGIVLSLTWLFAIRSYKRLNKAKFQVINSMEKDLPYHNFSDEWELLKRKTPNDNELTGLRQNWIKFKDRYTDLTNIEIVVPLVFSIMFVAILLGAIFKVIII